MSQTPSPSRSFKAAGVTVKDVAAQAGVSTATVSRVLSGKGGVRPELEQRVRSAIDSLDYHPNQSARRLRERKARIIGVLVPEILIPFFAGIVTYIDEVLQEAGYLLLLGNTHDTLQGEQEHINIFLGEDVSGIIFAAANSSDTSNYQRLLETRIPLVALDRAPGRLNIDSVQIDNVHAAAQAVRHLIEEGHSRIALITGPAQISTAVDRQAGYEQALRLAGIPVDQDLIQVGNYVQTGGYRAMQRILALPGRPTAVLVGDTAMALGAMQHIHELNLDIPGDIAIISFDDLPWATAVRPPLTVIAQPVKDIGITAAQLMLERIENPLAPIQRIVLDTSLVLRGSCRCGGCEPPAEIQPASLHSPLAYPINPD
jgi:LacI family transcriptional regulator